MDTGGITEPRPRIYRCCERLTCIILKQPCNSNFFLGRESKQRETRMSRNACKTQHQKRRGHTRRSLRHRHQYEANFQDIAKLCRKLDQALFFPCYPTLNFCSETCQQIAENSYHKSICGKDFCGSCDAVKSNDFVTRSNARDSLMFLRILAICRQSGGHPLHNLAIAWLVPNYSGILDSSQPWSMTAHVTGPLDIFQALGEDIYSPKYDFWVLQTIWSVFIPNFQKIRNVIKLTSYPLGIASRTTPEPMVVMENYSEWYFIPCILSSTIAVPQTLWRRTLAKIPLRELWSTQRKISRREMKYLLLTLNLVNWDFRETWGIRDCRGLEDIVALVNDASLRLIRKSWGVMRVKESHVCCNFELSVTKYGVLVLAMQKRINQDSYRNSTFNRSMLIRLQKSPSLINLCVQLPSYSIPFNLIQTFSPSPEPTYPISWKDRSNCPLSRGWVLMLEHPLLQNISVIKETKLDLLNWICESHVKMSEQL